jgi:hypothetical protein
MITGGKFMSGSFKMAVDFQKKIIKGISAFVADRGYNTGELPFIPQLFLQNATFIPKAIKEVDRVGMMGNGLYRHLYVSFFGGITATYFWHYAKNSLKNRGLYDMCTELCPLKDLDQLAYGLMGLNTAEGEYEIKELFYEIFNYVSWELDEQRENSSEETIKYYENELDKIFFHFGMCISLSKLGINFKDE